MSLLLQLKGGQIDRHEHPQYLLRSEHVVEHGGSGGGDLCCWRGICNSDSEVAILPHVSGVVTFGIYSSLTKNLTTGVLTGFTQTFQGGGPGTDNDLTGGATVWVTSGGTITIQRTSGTDPLEVTFLYLWV